MSWTSCSVIFVFHQARCTSTPISISECHTKPQVSVSSTQPLFPLNLLAFLRKIRSKARLSAKPWLEHGTVPPTQLHRFDMTVRGSCSSVPWDSVRRVTVYCSDSCQCQPDRSLWALRSSRVLCSREALTCKSAGHTPSHGWRYKTVEPLQVRTTFSISLQQSPAVSSRAIQVLSSVQSPPFIYHSIESSPKMRAAIFLSTLAVAYAAPAPQMINIGAVEAQKITTVVPPAAAATDAVVYNAASAASKAAEEITANGLLKRTDCGVHDPCCAQPDG